jgi:CrcB protein
LIRLEWLMVGVGGALGSMARHAVNVMVARKYGEPAPYATVIVNLTGCLAIGLLGGLLAGGRLFMSHEVRVFVFVGVLGGFTTFSTFGLDTFALVQSGRILAALGNVAAQVVVGLSCVAGGYVVGTAISRV